MSTASQPFKRLPRLVIFKRMFGPMFVAYLIGFLIMGILANQPYFQNAAEQYCAISPAPFSVGGSPVEAGKRLQELVFHYLANIPPGCLSGSTVSEFHARQCGIFWARLVNLGALSFLPFALALVLYWFALDWVGLKYRSARRKIDKERALKSGVVANPVEGPLDLPSWVLGMRVVYLTLSNGEPLSVYYSSTVPCPLPGQTIAVYSWGKIGKEQRYFGVLYAPHMAVVSEPG